MNQEHGIVGAINLKPNKPETYDGRRDFLAVNTWLFNVEQYLLLSQLSNPNVPIADESRIRFASSYLKGTASVWWFNLFSAGIIPATWNEFKAAVIREFVPSDHSKRARDRLRKLRQTKSVSRYLSDFRNIILAISGMTDEEKMDRFIEGLKHSIRIEVLKAQVDTFEDCARVALNIDSAIWRAGKGTGQTFGNRSGDEGPTPMEIGNVEGSSNPRTKAQREQRRKDLEKGACFTCHKVGCRPWKPARQANNVEADVDSDSSSELGSEN